MIQHSSLIVPKTLKKNSSINMNIAFSTKKKNVYVVSTDCNLIVKT